MGSLRDWVPLLSELVWPLFIGGVFVAFRAQVGRLFEALVAAVGEGRAVELGDWLKIGEKTAIGDLGGATAQADAGDGPERIDISVEKVGGYRDFVEKSSYSVLEDVRQQLQRDPRRRIDVLLVTSGKRYDAQLLARYISTLGIRFVVFERDGRFDGWLDAGMFNAQLPTQEQSLAYDDLRSGLLGIHTDRVAPDASALAVLRTMDDARSEFVAVVDDDRFRFIAERGGILSRLMTSALLARAPGR